MSRAIENYICASEDRPHYNNESWDLYGFYYPVRHPEVTIIQQVYKEEKVPDKRLNELIDARIPQLTKDITDEVIADIGKEDWEINGGTASDVIDLIGG